MCQVRKFALVCKVAVGVDSAAIILFLLGGSKVEKDNSVEKALKWSKNAVGKDKNPRRMSMYSFVNTIDRPRCPSYYENKTIQKCLGGGTSMLVVRNHSLLLNRVYFTDSEVRKDDAKSDTYP